MRYPVAKKILPESIFCGLSYLIHLIHFSPILSISKKKNPYWLFYFLQNQNKQRIFIFWTKYWIGCHVWNETKRWLLSNIEKRTYWTHFLVRPFQKGFFNPKVKIISNLWLGQFFEMVWKNSPQTCVCTACLLWCNAACLDVQSFYSRLHIQDCINSRYYGVAQFQEGIANVLR